MSACEVSEGTSAGDGGTATATMVAVGTPAETTGEILLGGEASDGDPLMGGMGHIRPMPWNRIGRKLVK